MLRRRKRGLFSDAPQSTVAARGGISLAAVLTGVVVALGVLVLLVVGVGGTLAAAGTPIEELLDVGFVDTAVVTGALLVVTEFIAYFWGGYTAGRMGRGAGFLNGLFVPLVTLIMLVALGALVQVLGLPNELNIPFTTSRLPLDISGALELGSTLSVAALIAMLVGGVAGGMMGARWHTKLERKAFDRGLEERSATDALDTGPKNTYDRGVDERGALAERSARRREEQRTREMSASPPETTQSGPVVHRHTTPTDSNRR
jgi:hypothetical protein